MRHEQVAIVSVETETVPAVPEAERLTVDDLGYARDGITHVTLRFGYTEAPDVPAALATLTPQQTEGHLDLDNAVYFLSQVELRAGSDAGMAALAQAPVPRDRPYRRRRQRPLRPAARPRRSPGRTRRGVTSTGS